MLLRLLQVSAPIYTEISTVLAKKSVSMHYRRTELRLVTMPKDKLEFNSDQLFSDEMPCRIVVFFVEESARKGEFTHDIFRTCLFVT